MYSVISEDSLSNFKKLNSAELDEYENYDSYDGLNSDYSDSSSSESDLSSSSSSFTDYGGGKDYTEEQCHEFENNGDERCVCQKMEGQGGELADYETHICYETENGPITVRDVCNGTDNDGYKICALNGCGDIIMDQIKYVYIIPIGATAVFLAAFYLLGVVFSVQLTNDYRKIENYSHMSAARKQGSKIVRRATSVKRSLGKSSTLPESVPLSSGS